MKGIKTKIKAVILFILSIPVKMLFSRKNLHCKRLCQIKNSLNK